jgi:hypothetical protein
VTGDDFNRGARHIQTIGQKLNAHPVGGIIDGWGLNGNFESISVKPDNPVPG